MLLIIPGKIIIKFEIIHFEFKEIEFKRKKNFCLNAYHLKRMHRTTRVSRNLLFYFLQFFTMCYIPYQINVNIMLYLHVFRVILIHMEVTFLLVFVFYLDILMCGMASYTECDYINLIFIFNFFHFSSRKSVHCVFTQMHIFGALEFCVFVMHAYIVIRLFPSVIIYLIINLDGSC